MNRFQKKKIATSSPTSTKTVETNIADTDRSSGAQPSYHTGISMTQFESFHLFDKGDVDSTTSRRNSNASDSLIPTSSSIETKTATDLLSPKSSSANPSHSRNISGASGSSSGSAICLCQPDPKVPRPRNAFILYRQHYQASILAQNPGLANPEISKIIGEQWRSQPPNIKSEWKLLAEQEKFRHQQLYPEYRYQPRRSRRGSNSSGGPLSADKAHCSKCGGRTIITPSSGHNTSQYLPKSFSPSDKFTKQSPPSRLPTSMMNLSMQSPSTRGRRPLPPQLSNIPTNNFHGRSVGPGSMSPMSPDAKRRRTISQVVPYLPHTGRPGETTPYSLGFPTNRRESASRPEHMIRHSPTTIMGPPRPVLGHISRTPTLVRHADHQDNVTLPPIQILRGDQSRSVEAMVMSMSYLGKVKILRKITPPLKPPGPMSPANDVRGAVVAIEGENMEAVRALAKWLEDFLNTSGDDYVAKIAAGPKMPNEAQDVTLADYLEIIREWHAKSEEMKEFITSPIREADGDISASRAQPVIILPTYQLATADAYACRVPIADSYSPTDHWQWMATMWRGVIGPDITIYIRNTTLEDLERKERVVEVREDTKCLVVSKDKESSNVEDRALRRVGFEVSEWIRAIGVGITRPGE